MYFDKDFDLTDVRNVLSDPAAIPTIVPVGAVPRDRPKAESVAVLYY
jgi:hypothetical protein